MKIIGFVGSKRDGNTKKLTEAALDAAKAAGAETQLIHIGKMNISPCKACDTCKKAGKCIIEDDFQKAEELLASADGVIFGSPVYFGGVSAQMKAFMDRTRTLRRKSALKDKVGGAIAVGASRNGGQETTIQQIHNYFFIQEMLVVSDASTAHYGGTGVAGAPGDASKDEFGMETARNLGTHVASVAKKLKSVL
ncbi:MAG: flavodoxin family protein [archaeon]|nr:flavodoxin family protein [archaeon]